MQYANTGASQLDLNLTPSLDYFVVRQISVGLEASLTYSRSDGSMVRTDTSSVSLGPRVGVNFPLGAVASLWPRLSLAGESVHRDAEPLPGASATAAGSLVRPTTLPGFTLGLRFPLVVQVTPHFFLDMGPGILHAFGPAQGEPGTGGQRTNLSASVVVGGYFGGESPASPAESPASSPPPSRFGKARQVVLTSDDSLGASYIAYSGTGASLATLSLALGVDYFVVDHVSFGFLVTGNYSRPATEGPRGSNVSASDSFALGPQIGVNVPLGSRFSIYPRTSLTLGPAETQQDADGRASETTSSLAVLSISVPFLFHPAEHVFLGVGPSASQQLARSVTSAGSTSTEYTGSTLGAEFVLGGWL
jgi:hypothetical protein